MTGFCPIVLCFQQTGFQQISVSIKIVPPIRRYRVDQKKKNFDLDQLERYGFSQGVQQLAFYIL